MEALQIPGFQPLRVNSQASHTLPTHGPAGVFTDLLAGPSVSVCLSSVGNLARLYWILVRDTTARQQNSRTLADTGRAGGVCVLVAGFCSKVQI